MVLKIPSLTSFPTITALFLLIAFLQTSVFMKAFNFFFL